MTVPVQVDQLPPEPAALRSLALAAIDRIEALSPWRPYVTRVMPNPTQTAYADTFFASSVLSYTTLAGPSAQISGQWVRTDHVGTSQSVAADISWTTGANITPHEFYVLSTLSEEQVDDASTFPFVEVRNGQPVPLPYGRIDPVIVDALADAVVRDENTAFAKGAGSTTDPITGLVNISGITSTASTGTYSEITAAVMAQRILKWTPNAIFVSPALEQKLRNEKDANGQLLFEPGEPLIIADLPVVTLNGLPSGTTHCVLGDFRKIVVAHRPMSNGLLLQVKTSNLGSNFAVMKKTYRLAERWDMGLTPGFGTAITKLTGIVAP